jgi:hypothetical protein
MVLKATPEDIRRLTAELQEKGLVNLDRPTRDLLTLEGLKGIPGLERDDPSVLGWYVVGGSSYVLVCE